MLSLRTNKISCWVFASAVVVAFAFPMSVCAEDGAPINTELKKSSLIEYTVDQKERTLSLPLGSYSLMFVPGFMTDHAYPVAHWSPNALGSGSTMVIANGDTILRWLRARRSETAAALRLCSYPRVSPFSVLTLTPGYKTLAAIQGPIPNIRMAPLARTLNETLFNSSDPSRRGFTMRAGDAWLAPDSCWPKDGRVYRCGGLRLGLVAQMLEKGDLIAARCFLEETLNDGWPLPAESILMSAILERTGNHSAARRTYDFYEFASQPGVSVHPHRTPAAGPQDFRILRPRFKLGFGDTF